jgi:hypothetical protein
LDTVATPSRPLKSYVTVAPVSVSGSEPYRIGHVTTPGVSAATVVSGM